MEMEELTVDSRFVACEERSPATEPTFDAHQECSFFLSRAQIEASAFRRRRALIPGLLIFVLLLLSLLVNAYFIRKGGNYLLVRPADSSFFYSAAQIDAARDFLRLESAPALTELQTTLEHDLLLPALSSTFEKIEAVGLYILAAINHVEGLAPLPATTRSGIEALRMQQHGEQTIWPSAVARVYVAIANAAGIPSRLVRLVAGGATDSYWFAESYIAEQDRWAFVDLSRRKFYVADWVGEAISAAELLAAIATGDIDHLDVALFEGGGVVHCPYAERAASELAMFSADASLEFPSAKDLSSSRLRTLQAYLFSPAKTFTLNPQVFTPWSRAKFSLLAVTTILAVTLALMCASRLRAARS